MDPNSLKRSLSTTDGAVSPPPTKRRFTPTTTTSTISTTTSKAVQNFFRPVSEKIQEAASLSNVKFQILHETLITAHHNAPTTNAKLSNKAVKIAAFDFDDTLIATKSGLKFSRGEGDWKWWHPSVPAKLKQLVSDGYIVVVVSNQAGVSLRSDGGSKGGAMRSLGNLKAKVSAVFRALDLEGGIGFYAATEHDLYRKPRTGMWKQILVDYGLGEGEVDLEGSVFVGDAAGRGLGVAGKGVKGARKDHSCSDRDFAANVGMSFQTPEEFFLDEKVQPFGRLFDPKDYLDLQADANGHTPAFAKKNEQDIVLFVGSPGAGKSTFYWRHCQPLGYERVNQDILKSRERCLKVAAGFLQDGKSVVVDNTNADIETRAAWMALAKKAGVDVRVVLFIAPVKLCEHNNVVRALGGITTNPENRILLPKMAFTGFGARYREPQLKEGFQDITKVDFKFEGTEEEKRVWGMYWLS